MHDAPAVTYPVGRAPALGALLGAVWFGGAGAWLAGWQMAAWALDGRSALGAASVVLAGGLALLGWRTLPSGELDWNGQEWMARLGGRAVVLGGVAVHLDLQAWLLLRVRIPATGCACWIWAGRSAAPDRWSDLRRALFNTRPASETAVAAPAP